MSFPSISSVVPLLLGFHSFVQQKLVNWYGVGHLRMLSVTQGQIPALCMHVFDKIIKDIRQCKKSVCGNLSWSLSFPEVHFALTCSLVVMWETSVLSHFVIWMPEFGKIMYDLNPNTYSIRNHPYIRSFCPFFLHE